jgi:hypothetical protein
MYRAKMKRDPLLFAAFGARHAVAFAKVSRDITRSRLAVE